MSDDSWVGPAQGIDSTISQKNEARSKLSSRSIASLRSSRLKEISSEKSTFGNSSKVDTDWWRDGLALPSDLNRNNLTACKPNEGEKGNASLFDGFTNPILRLVSELAKDVWLDGAGPQPSRIRRVTRLCLL